MPSAMMTARPGMHRLQLTEAMVQEAVVWVLQTWPRERFVWLPLPVFFVRTEE